jgi:hypothetical protein
LDTREVLQAAINNLEAGEPFSFLYWTSCACGHIYKAANGEKAAVTEDVFTYRNDVYSHTMLETAYALGMEPELLADSAQLLESAVLYVSHVTHGMGIGMSFRVTADMVISLFQEAIKALDERAVLEQLKEVADNVERLVTV